MQRNTATTAFVMTLALFIPAQAQMVRNDSIGNDSAKERLCASRALVHSPKGKIVPFEIESRYVARARSSHPDATFVAIDEPFSGGQLVECWLLAGTGRYEPATFMPENAAYWRLIKPKQFEPRINMPKVAESVCLKAAAAPAKTKHPNFDHSVDSGGAVEVGAGSKIIVAGQKAERYDVVVNGTSFYKSAGLDLTAVEFTCLLSPTLVLKAIQFK